MNYYYLNICKRRCESYLENLTDKSRSSWSRWWLSNYSCLRWRCVRCCSRCSSLNRETFNKFVTSWRDTELLVPNRISKDVYWLGLTGVSTQSPRIFCVLCLSIYLIYFQLSFSWHQSDNYSNKIVIKIQCALQTWVTKLTPDSTCCPCPVAKTPIWPCRPISCMGFPLR